MRLTLITKPIAMQVNNDEQRLNLIEVSHSTKLSHKKWRALMKKRKKKLKRQEEAKCKEEIEKKEEEAKQISPSFVTKQKEEEERIKLSEQRDEAERAYLHKLWEERERLAQEEFKRKKEWEEKEKIRREETEKQIREEWEERQRKEKEEEKVKEKKKEKQDELLRQATANENKDGPWHNPIATVIQGKERETCMFFSKTGTCRFGDRCSRGHPHPDISNTLMFPGMYTHFELEQGLRDEYDTDLILEYEDGELYQNFKDFYEDIIPEFKAIGRVIQVKVCCNYESHLRGNVYVQYKRESDAQEAFVKFNGRYYGGKQISCEYVDIKKWKSAVCGLFGSGRCPKGKNCNFLHVFRNPGNEFRDADFDFDRSNKNESRIFSERSVSRSQRHRSRSKERKYRKRSRSKDRKYSRSRSRNRSRKYSRSRSRDRNRRYSRSRSRDRNRKYSRSRSRDRSRRAYSKNQDRHKKHYKNSLSRSRSRSQSRTRSKYRSKYRSRSRSRSESKHRKSIDEYDLRDYTKEEKINNEETNGKDFVDNLMVKSTNKWDSDEETELPNDLDRKSELEQNEDNVQNTESNNPINWEKYNRDVFHNDSADSDHGASKKHKKYKKHKKHKKKENE